MKCLETRRRHGMKWRRYRTPAGFDITTYELPEEVVRRLCMSRVKEEVARYERKYARLNRQAKVLGLLADGWKPDAVAHEVGLSDSQVYRIRIAGKVGAKTMGAKR